MAGGRRAVGGGAAARPATPVATDGLVPSEATDEALVAAARGGDEDALTELLRRCRPLIRARARSYFLVGAERDDIVQEGMIGLYKAVRDFDASNGTPFRAFADLCATRQIVTAVRAATALRHGPLNRSISLDAQLAQDGVEPAEPDAADEGLGHLAELAALCRDVMTDLEAEVLDRYVRGESYAEIADALDRHVKAIDNALQRVRRKLVAAHRSVGTDDD